MKFKRGLIVLLLCLVLISSFGVVDSLRRSVGGTGVTPPSENDRTTRTSQTTYSTPGETWCGSAEEKDSCEDEGGSQTYDCIWDSDNGKCIPRWSGVIQCNRFGQMDSSRRLPECNSNAPSVCSSNVDCTGHFDYCLKKCRRCSGSPSGCINYHQGWLDDKCTCPCTTTDCQNSKSGCSWNTPYCEGIAYCENIDNPEDYSECSCNGECTDSSGNCYIEGEPRSDGKICQSDGTWEDPPECDDDDDCSGWAYCSDGECFFCSDSSSDCSHCGGTWEGYLKCMTKEKAERNNLFDCADKRGEDCYSSCSDTTNYKACCINKQDPCIKPSIRGVKCYSESYYVRWSGDTSSNTYYHPNSRYVVNGESHVCANHNWVDPDRGEGYCEGLLGDRGNLNFNGETDYWISSGETNNFGEYATGQTNAECCGDDRGEYFSERRLDESLSNLNDPTDIACCDNYWDCVYNGECYEEDSKLNINGNEIICIDDKWYRDSLCYQDPSKGYKNFEYYDSNFNYCLSAESEEECCNSFEECMIYENNAVLDCTRLNPKECSSQNVCTNTTKSCLPTQQLSTRCDACNNMVTSTTECCQNTNGCSMKEGECKSVCPSADENECGTYAKDKNSLLDCETFFGGQFESCASNAGESACCGFSQFNGECEMVGRNCVLSSSINDYSGCVWGECVINEHCDERFICENNDCVGVECTSDDNCNFGETCSDGKCVELEIEMYWGYNEYAKDREEGKYTGKEIELTESAPITELYMIIKNFPQGTYDIGVHKKNTLSFLIGDKFIKNVNADITKDSQAVLVKISKDDLNGIIREGSTGKIYFKIQTNENEFESSDEDYDGEPKYLEIKNSDTIGDCNEIYSCSNYNETGECMGDKCNIANESVEENKGEGFCGNKTFVNKVGCNKTIVCECSWDSSSKECSPASGDVWLSNECTEGNEIPGDENLKIGECRMKENTSADPNGCNDGIMHYEWTGEWAWGNGNSFNTKEECDTNGNDFCIEKNGKWHFDPEKKYQECITTKKTNEVSCPSKLKLPFFSWINVIAVVLVIAVIYYFISRNNQNKKNSNSKKTSSKKSRKNKKSSGKSKKKSKNK